MQLLCGPQLILEIFILSASNEFTVSIVLLNCLPLHLKGNGKSLTYSKYRAIMSYFHYAQPRKGIQFFKLATAVLN